MRCAAAAAGDPRYGGWKHCRCARPRPQKLTLYELPSRIGRNGLVSHAGCCEVFHIIAFNFVLGTKELAPRVAKKFIYSSCPLAAFKLTST